MDSDSRILSVVIVDDEELARAVLREYLGAHPDMKIVGECADGFDAVKVISASNPDLIFLDIQMPKLNGFEVLELLGEGHNVVFATAHDEYALKAFEVHAVDYILKPFSPERLAEALERARNRISSGESPNLSDMVKAAKRDAGPVGRVLIRDGSKVHVIPITKIDFIQAQDDYVSIRAEGREYLKQETLADLAKQLDPDQFIRVHRSYILNIERLARIELYSKDSRLAILTDGTQVPVSRSGYARLKPLL